VRHFHCAPPGVRLDIERVGLLVSQSHKCLYTWPTLEAAEEWRNGVQGGWLDIWAFDDRGRRSELIGTMSAGAEGRCFEENIPPEELTLIRRAGQD